MNSNEKEPLLIEPSPEASSSDVSLGFQRKTPDIKPSKLAKSSKPPRKRSRIACTWCRDRKVRCDASSHGVPCTNCALDQQECVVHSASLNTRTKRATSSRRQPYPSPTPSTLKASIFQVSDASSGSPLITHTWNGADQSPSQGPWTTPPHSSRSPPSPISSVFYTFHQFIKFSGLSEIPPEDIQYLSLKGCFCVPAGEVLDDFVRKYFLYVHPCLPIIDEAGFWEMYYHTPSQRFDPDSVDMETSRISLFVFQAMLFASSMFVSPDTIKAAGFPDARSARNTLYTRAKLVYDLCPPKNPLHTIQAAILLSEHGPPSNLHTGTTWLSIAIQNAIVYNALSPSSNSNPDAKRVNMNRRVRWCILLRDRIMALGLRRVPLMSGDGPGLGMVSADGSAIEGVLGERDLEYEYGRSEVYDPETKKLLAKVLAVRCEFVSVLGGVLSVLHSGNTGVESKFGINIGIGELNSQSRTQPSCLKQRIAECKTALLRWSTSAKSALGAVVNSHMTHESVGLFFGLTFFYYHAARLSLSNFEALTHHLHLTLGNERNTQTEGNTDKDTNSIYDRVQYDLEDSTDCITDTIKRFLAQGLAHQLPIDTTPLIAHPLLLLALDTKLALTKSQSATRKRRFRYYATLMQIYQSKHEGTDAVAGFIQRTLQVADLINSRATAKEKTVPDRDSGNTKWSVSSWSELFSSHPGVYLRISLALDLAFRRGWYPGYEEIYGILGSTDGDWTGGARLDFMVLRSNTLSSEVDLGIDDAGETAGLGLHLGNTDTFLDFEGGTDEKQQLEQQIDDKRGIPSVLMGDSTAPVLNSLVIPTYNTIMNAEYAYSAQLSSTQFSFAHQDYVCGTYEIRGQDILDERGSPEVLNLGSSGSEAY
ncbi:hypothetical protein BDV12DRAFT_211348 [Aspergillus spectabilis]